MDERGGAAKVAKELNERLNEREGVDADLLVGDKETESDDVINLKQGLVERTLTHAIERVLSLDGLGAPTSLTVPRMVSKQDYDIVHLHNIHGGYFNFLNVPRLIGSVPLVWTLHDMWPFTGNCTFSFDCERFTGSCGSCPHLDDYPPIRFDTTQLLLSLKTRLFDAGEVTMVGNSDWTTRHVVESRLKNVETTTINNGIDVERYAPRPPPVARSKFDIDPGKKTVLFISGNLGDKRKGASYLARALDHAGAGKDVALLAVGGGILPNEYIPDAVDVHTPGYVSPDKMPFAYSAADVCAIPSFGETFPLTSLEAMACETPVVAFAVGGLTEQLNEDVGWLVEPGDAEELAAVLKEVMTDEEIVEAKSGRARNRVQSQFSSTGMVESYLDLYEERLNTW